MFIRYHHTDIWAMHPPFLTATYGIDSYELLTYLLLLNNWEILTFACFRSSVILFFTLWLSMIMVIKAMSDCGTNSFWQPLDKNPRMIAWIFKTPWRITQDAQVKEIASSSALSRHASRSTCPISSSMLRITRRVWRVILPAHVRYHHQCLG